MIGALMPLVFYRSFVQWLGTVRQRLTLRATRKDMSPFVGAMPGSSATPECRICLGRGQGMRLLVFAWFLIFFLPTDTHAGRTIRVPSDQSTIQRAINTAVDGDTVLVARGTYFENIDFRGKAITVKSEEGADVTIIDGNQADSVVTFISGEMLASVLSVALTRSAGMRPSRWARHAAQANAPGHDGCGRRAD